MHMDITPYVDSLRRDLLAAAEAGGDEARQVAERLSYALDASARLAIMEAISQAAAEISTELPQGGVDVRLNGRELDFVVEVAPTAVVPRRPPPPPPPRRRGGGGGRPRPHHPPHPRVDQGPGRGEGRRRRAEPQHLARLVIRAATSDHAINVDIDLSSIPFFGHDPFKGGNRGNRRMTGWL